MVDPARTESDKALTRAHLEGYLDAYPGLRGRVCRLLLLHLHTAGISRIEDVYSRAERRSDWHLAGDANAPSDQLWAADEAEVINDIVIGLAAEHLSPDEVDRVVWAAQERDEAKGLEALSRMPDVPLELIARKVSQFCSLADKNRRLPVAPEGTLVALIRRFISERVEYITVAKRYLSIEDLCWVLERTIATEHGSGWAGGKAAGMLLAWAVLRRAGIEQLDLPNTLFVLTDVYMAFKEHNGLTELSDLKYQPLEEIRANHLAIQAVFQNAEFPPRIANRLRAELVRMGEVPLIVRSSSLLEDSFGAAFSGIYQSLFLPNQGSPEDRLRALLSAVAEIYAGVFHPNAISYRRRHDLIDHDERMGVMIQPVVGRTYGQYFFPAVSGVAFSRNDFPWNTRIRREDGMVRLVLGLGTHAVDRVGDSARMVALKAPTVRPEGTPDEILAASQRRADVIDLRGQGFTTIGVSEALDAMRPDDSIADYVSIVQHGGHLGAPIGNKVTEPSEDLVVTFNRLLERGAFTDRLHQVLKTLEEAYRVPVDFELTYAEDRIHVLQCRPLTSRDDSTRQRVPADIPARDQIFSANRWIRNGMLRDIDAIVLVEPAAYARIADVDRRYAVGRIVGRLNEALADKRFLLMGPGRWGSQDLRLGVRVGFADIANAKALIEIASTSEGLTAEPSFGTHFFQELVEASILYLALYPEEPGVVYSDAFLSEGPNALTDVLGESALEYTDIVRLIDVAKVAPGRHVELAMDGELQEALCYLR